MKSYLIKNKKESSRYIGTALIILINLVVFILLRSSGVLNEDILLNPRIEIILEKPWTLLTAFFAHENILHLVANMLLFYFFGKSLERLRGTKVLMMVYLTAGLFGSLSVSLVSYLIGDSELLLGASAAVFGIVSAVGVIAPNYRIFNTESKLLKSLFSATAIQYTLLLFLVNILMYALNPSMPFGAIAHATGIVIGALAGLFFRKSRRSLAL